MFSGYIVLLPVLLVSPIAIRNGTAAEPSSLPVRRMAPAEKVSFPVPPPTAVLTRTKCDVDGNVYVVETNAPATLLDPRGLSGVPVLKLSISSKSTVAYPVPALDGYRGVIRSDFDISNGKLYALVQALDASAGKDARASSLLVKYGDDGTVDSYVKLGDPPTGHLQPSQVTVFHGGSVLVTGTVASEEGSLRPVAAIFNGSSGRFVSYVNVTDYEKSPKSSESGKAPAEESDSGRAIGLASSTLMAAGADGNVYALVGAAHSRIYVISPIGDVIREFPVPLPAQGLATSNMGTAGTSGLFVSFGMVHGVSAESGNAHEAGNFVSFLNAQTGEATAVYQLSNDDGAEIPACAASADSFLFLGGSADHQRQQITKYSAR